MDFIRVEAAREESGLLLRAVVHPDDGAGERPPGFIEEHHGFPLRGDAQGENFPAGQARLRQNLPQAGFEGLPIDGHLLLHHEIRLGDEPVLLRGGADLPGLGIEQADLDRGGPEVHAEQVIHFRNPPITDKFSEKGGLLRPLLCDILGVDGLEAAEQGGEQRLLGDAIRGNGRW